MLCVIVFNVAAVLLLYQGLTSGDYAVVAVVLVAYVLFLTLQASLRPGTKAKPKK